MSSKQQFIVQKAQNFRKWIQSFNPPSEIQDYVDAFDDSMILATIHFAVIPAVDSGEHVQRVDELATKMNIPEHQRVEFKAKCIRYMEMFAELMDT